MNQNLTYLCYVAVMAGVTYLLRMLPVVIFRKKLKSAFIRQFLFYMPYAVLACMTVPAIFYATSSLWSAAAGFCIALLLSFLEKSLLTVACCACAVALGVQMLLQVCS